MIIQGIYFIKNIHTEKYYIGLSCDVKKRWASHRSELRSGSHQNRHLQRSFEKHGEKAFSFGILKIQEDENARKLDEIYFIKKYNSFNDGYNLTLGGDGNKGYITSEETKLKLRNKLLGRVVSADQRKRTSKTMTKDIDEIEMVKLFKDGLNLRDIAKIFNISGNTVTERLRNLGLKEPRKKLNRVKITENQILEFVNDGLSIKQIEKNVGLTSKSIYRRYPNLLEKMNKIKINKIIVYQALGLNRNQIAKLMNISEGTVRYRLKNFEDKS